MGHHQPFPFEPNQPDEVDMTLRNAPFTSLSRVALAAASFAALAAGGAVTFKLQVAF